MEDILKTAMKNEQPDLEKRVEKRAEKLNNRANKLEAKGKSVGDLRERATELTQSAQDIKDMRGNENTQFRYANTNGKEAQGLGISGQPATVGTGTNDGGAVQKLGMVGIKAFGDVSLTTSNDTGIMGGGGIDKGQTGNGTINVGGANGFSFSYTNYTGSYDTNQEPDNGGNASFGSFYQQTPYQQSLIQSAFRIDAQGTSVIGGTSNGSIQNAIHSVTGTGQFTYPDTTTDATNLFNLLYIR
jgi:hypothetical protein